MSDSPRFVHLHLHSEYSLLDGAIRFEKLGPFLRENGMDTVAVTDHGSLYGAVHFCDVMKSHGVTPIVGMEAYITPGSRHDRTDDSGEGIRHLTLLAADEEGYGNLCRLSSLGWTEGFYRKPRIDREILAQYRGGLLIGSACLQGEVAFHLARGRKTEALAAARFYQDLVGKDRYFIEIMDHGLPEEKGILSGLAEIARETGALPVATNDAHYLKREHAEVHEVLLCLQTKKTLSDPGRMRFGTNEFYVKTPGRVNSHVPCNT
jgi:DNA polymerase-3 subunit alpha